MSKPRQQRRRCPHIREKKGIGAKNGIETPPVSENNRGRTEKMNCKPAAREENHEKAPRWSWARNQMGNPDIHLITMVGCLVLCFFVTGCKTPLASIQYYPPPISNSGYSKEADGLRITIDPVCDKERSQHYFDSDALSNGIFPVHVLLENTSADASFLIRKQNFTLAVTVGTRPNVNATGTDVRSRPSEAAEAIGGALLSPALMLAGVPGLANAQALQHNFVRAELLDQTLSSGQGASGFVYFQVSEADAKAGSILRFNALDVQSQRNTQFEFSVKP